ncbi:hypothetical protein J6590_048079 [Homalodisca vitripennis]|nr:hypothetical protein J6590_048079 [Homalodisca vitripennis]
MGGVEGVKGAWAYPEGGMGAVSAAIATSARSFGAELYTDQDYCKPVVCYVSGPASPVTSPSVLILLDSLYRSLARYQSTLSPAGLLARL